MNAIDVVPPLKGHFKLEVFDGDVERKPLTKDQQVENAFWIERQREQNELWEKILGRPVEQILLPAHAGQIVSKPIEVLEGDNVVLTTGKNILLDRLFAVGTPPTQVTSLGVGNSATAAAVGDTTLLGATPAPYFQAFDALPTRSGLVVTSVTSIATGNGNQIWQELCQANATSNASGTLFNRIAPIGPFTKTSAVSIVVTVTTTQT